MIQLCVDALPACLSMRLVLLAGDLDILLVLYIATSGFFSVKGSSRRAAK